MTHRSLPRLLAVVLACVFAACGPTPTSPSPYAAYSQTDLLVGTGEEAVSGRRVGVRYTLWLYDPAKAETKGLLVETNAGATDPFSFTLGTNSVIQGWERGVPGMRVGGRRRLVIPPDLAYGDTRSGVIPQSATLVFDIELVSVTTP